MDEKTYTLATKAAWYYYMENYTQHQIAEAMGLSRAKVIRLLEDAKTDGIIQFNFRKDDSTRVSLEKNLIAAYGLNDAFVVPTPLNEATLTHTISRAAALYVSDHLRPGGYLNIGCVGCRTERFPVCRSTVCGCQKRGSNQKKRRYTGTYAMG